MGVLKRGLGCLSAIALAALLASTLAQEALALSKQATDFLLSISIDPTSENVKLADQDGTIKTEYQGDPEEYSLESLAIAKKTNGVKSFIITRTLIRRLKADFSRTALPKSGDPLHNWDPIYLTVDERALVGRKFREGK